jgi:hypothetical protein
MIHGNLKDPNSGEVRDTVSARELWQRILEIRMQTGEPYLHFIDTSNKAMPEFQKKLGLSIKQSNLCSEIILPTDKERTAVCCLSSLNLEHFDDWKNETIFLRDVAEMLTMYYSILLTMLLIELGVQSFLLHGKGQLVLALLVGMPTFSAIALYGSLRWPHQPITRFLNTYGHSLIKQIFHSVKKEVRHLMLQARAFVSHT